jgi:dihydrofolate reductase
MRVPLVLVAAVAENGVIGRAGALPWRLKTDLRHFRSLTWGHPIVMGRRTFCAIGRALKGRTNIVVSRDRSFSAPGVLVAPNLDSALQAAHGDALRRGADAIMIVGGGDIYAQTIGLAQRLEVTRVHARPEGDAFFPPVDRELWREIARRECRAGAEDETSFTLLTYRRVAARVPNA